MCSISPKWTVGIVLCLFSDCWLGNNLEMNYKFLTFVRICSLNIQTLEAMLSNLSYIHVCTFPTQNQWNRIQWNNRVRNVSVYQLYMCFLKPIYFLWTSVWLISKSSIHLWLWIICFRKRENCLSIISILGTKTLCDQAITHDCLQAIYMIVVETVTFTVKSTELGLLFYSRIHSHIFGVLLHVVIFCQNLYLVNFVHVLCTCVSDKEILVRLLYSVSGITNV